MPLEYQVATLDGVPESLRGEYAAQEDGSFRLNVNGLDDAGRLHKALVAERAANKSFKPYAKNAADIEKALKDHAELAHLPDDFKATLEQAEKANAAKISVMEVELKAARDSERRAIVDACIAESLTRAKATGEGIDLLSERLADRVVLSTENGKRRIVINDSKGQPMKGSGPGGAATFADLAKEATATFPSLFQSTGAGGGGKSPRSSDNTGRTGDGTKSLSRVEFDRLSPAERMSKMKSGYSLHD